MINKMLLIEDDKEMCEELTELLRNEGYDVDVANEGLKGMKLLECSHYDLLLLDLKLPDVSGLEILERIKREKQDLKIIVISGSPLAAKTDGAPQIDQKDICRLAQFTNAVISKPFTPDEIISTIQSLTKPTDMFR